ncbi:DUF6515 family protein [Roseibium marinum]|uniref:Uncharacterized protein n=1 Tax=Roseibium marinum TaxID=281252 RepID=A0A2S3UY30_9HYPH|nr:DUF6515 family protein [Roseibium marinum]POF32631.1 hypothetical protein CLV41_10234 [Roseibium marinum]
MRKILISALSAFLIYGLVPATVHLASTDHAEARGGGHRGGGGGGGRHTVNNRAGGGGVHRQVNNTVVNRNNTVVNRKNVDVNINRNTNINVDSHYYDNRHHPVATAAAITAAAVAVGTIVASLPSGCSQVVVNGIVYQQCGNAWYAPQYQGTTVNYIVVNPPR